MSNITVDLDEFATLVPIKALNPDRCRELAEKSEVCLVRKGTEVFAQGEDVTHIIYVLAGHVELLKDGEATKRVKGGSKMSKLPLEQGKHYQHTARALTDLKYVKVDPDELDMMLSWDQSGGYEVQDIHGDESEDEGDWMSKLLQAKVFHRIPPGNIQSIFMRLETQHFKAGEVVINQGEEGEHFFLIRKGKCKVTRKTRKNPEGIVLATLSDGDNFGEEALISGGKRNASVVMETDGVLMSLPKADFLELMNEPLLKWITFSDAKTLVPEGALWIDVRLPQEFKTQHIKGSVNIPLPLLRTKLEILDVKHRYLIYCDTGRRSSIATYLLSQNGFDAYVLQGSIESVPASEME